MKSKFGAAVLSSLLYAQGLLGVSAVAAVLLKEPAHAGSLTATERLAATDTVETFSAI